MPSHSSQFVRSIHDFNSFMSHQWFHFIQSSSFVSNHSFQFIRFNLLIFTHFNSFMSFNEFKSFVSTHSFQSIHSFQFLNFNSFMPTHSLTKSFMSTQSFRSPMSSCWFQFFNLNSFVSFIQFNPFLSIRSCQLIHVKAFISCISFHPNSLLSNSPWTPFFAMPLETSARACAKGTTWYSYGILWQVITMPHWYYRDSLGMASASQGHVLGQSAAQDLLLPPISSAVEQDWYELFVPILILSL